MAIIGALVQNSDTVPLNLTDSLVKIEKEIFLTYIWLYLKQYTDHGKRITFLFSKCTQQLLNLYLRCFFLYPEIPNP